MNSIFFGMIFVFFDFHLDLDAMRIGLIPDFIGYYFMYKGLREIGGLSPRFAKTEPFVVGMLVFSAVSYLLDLVGMASAFGGVAGTILSLAALALSLYISYSIIMGIKDIEADRGVNLDSARLYSVWKLQVVFSAISFVLLLVPVLAFVSILVSVAISAYYLYVFHKTRRLFNEHISVDTP